MRQRVAKALKRAIFRKHDFEGKAAWLKAIADKDTLVHTNHKNGRMTISRPVDAKRHVYRQKKKLWNSTPWVKKAAIFDIIRVMK